MSNFSCWQTSGFFENISNLSFSLEKTKNTLYTYYVKNSNKKQTTDFICNEGDYPTSTPLIEYRYIQISNIQGGQ